MRRLVLVLPFVVACGRVAFDATTAADALGSGSGTGDGGSSTGDGGTADSSVPQSLTVGPLADVDIVMMDNTNNEGATQVMVGRTMGGNDSAALFVFDLSAIPPSAFVTNAVLAVDVITSMGTGTLGVELRTITNGWSAATVTYATRPSAVLFTTVGLPLNVPGEYLLDCTAMVRGWVDMSTPNFGVMLGASGAPNGALIQIGSVEQGPATQRPELRVMW